MLVLYVYTCSISSIVSLKQGWTFCSNTFCLCCVGDGKMELIGKHTFTCTCHKPRFHVSDPFGRYFDDHDWQPRGRRPPYLCCSAHSWEEDEDVLSICVYIVYGFDLQVFDFMFSLPAAKAKRRSPGCSVFKCFGLSTDQSGSNHF